MSLGCPQREPSSPGRGDSSRERDRHAGVGEGQTLRKISGAADGERKAKSKDSVIETLGEDMVMMGEV